ncbi:hypothetical protein Dimus_013942 [Dionaea muscipula]
MSSDEVNQVYKAYAVVAFRGGGFDYVAVDGVRILNPDVYLRPHLVVHGLDGALQAAISPPESIHGGLGFVLPPLQPLRFVPPSSSCFRSNVGAAAPLAVEISPPTTSSGSVVDPASVTAAGVFDLGGCGFNDISASCYGTHRGYRFLDGGDLTSAEPLDLDSILPLNRPLISPEIPQNLTPTNPRTHPADSSLKGAVQTSPHRFETPQLIRHPVSSTPVDDFLLEIPEQDGFQWNS